MTNISKNLVIRAMQENDWESVAQIYQEGMDTDMATFETQVPSWEKWNLGHLKVCRLVVEQDHKVVAWAALSPVSTRAVYAGVAELSIYVATESKGKGFGSILMGRVIEESERVGIWTLQSSIFSENTISIHLHQKSGFRIVGYRERIAQRNGIWRNTHILERRSPHGVVSGEL